MCEFKVYREGERERGSVELPAARERRILFGDAIESKHYTVVVVIIVSDSLPGLSEVQEAVVYPVLHTALE